MLQVIQCINNLVFCITPVFIVVFSALYDILDELSLGNGIFTIVIKAVIIQIIDTGQSFSHGRRYGIIQIQTRSFTGKERFFF